jgi:glycosyltransferase involved in cell wall biosynthesis
MNVSIVIPVYNEAERLGACLEAIALQRVKPLEVIVVDNNSTDETVRVAQSFPFVRLLREPRQGVVHARTRGFNAARGTIIGRIDADTLLPDDWVANVLEIFADRTVTAVSGSAHYYDFALHMIADRVDAYLRQRLAQQLGDRNYLWGANMAMRRSAWLRINPLLCKAAAIHEDFDIGIHLQELGYQVDYRSELNAGVSSRRVDSDFMDYFRYTMVSPFTYKHHGLSGRRHMYLILSICWLTYLPGRLLYRGYDHETRTFSLLKALAVTNPRVDPTTNIV